MIREAHLVELVDSAGRPTGSCSVAEAHTAPGKAHRAFSVLLISDDGRVLLQQRSTLKTRFAGRWANTCCGHPAPGQSVTDAARIRLTEEMGLSGIPLREIGHFTYRAIDDATGRVEHEYDHVLIGHTSGTPTPNPDPAEISTWAWVPITTLRRALCVTPDKYAPWLAAVIALACPPHPPELVASSISAAQAMSRPHPR